MIRQFDSNLVMVPNFKFSEQSVTNFTRRKNRRIRWIVGLEYRTSIEQLKNIRTQIKDFIDKDANFANDGSSYFNSSYVRIDSFSDSSIDMLVQCFVSKDDWDEYYDRDIGYFCFAKLDDLIFLEHPTSPCRIMNSLTFMRFRPPLVT